MTEATQKQDGYIDGIRDYLRRLREIMDEGRSKYAQWTGTYVAIITEEDDFANHFQIIPSPNPETGSRLTSFVDSVGTIDTIVSTFDSGQSAVTEKVSS